MSDEPRAWRLKVLELALVVLPLALIGVGAWMAWPPLGLLTVGLLLWWDLRPTPPPRAERKQRRGRTRT